MFLIFEGEQNYKLIREIENPHIFEAIDFLTFFFDNNTKGLLNRINFDNNQQVVVQILDTWC